MHIEMARVRSLNWTTVRANVEENVDLSLMMTLGMRPARIKVNVKYAGVWVMKLRQNATTDNTSTNDSN